MTQILTRRFVFASVLAFSCLLIFAGRATNATAEDAIEKALKEGAEQVNNMTLSFDDAGVKLERAEAGKRIFIYYYTMSKTLKTDYKPGQFKKKIHPLLKENVCFSSHMKRDFFDNGVTVKYVYQDKNKDFIDSIIITPKTCGY